MRKRILLVTMILALVLCTSSCSLIIKDEAVDMETVIVEVAGQSITKGEIVTQQEQVLDYQEMLYSMYGLTYDRTDASNIASAQDTVIESVIQSAVLDQKAIEMGFDTFTDEELAEIEASAQSTYDTYVMQVEMSDFASTELEGDELTAAVAAATEAYGITLEALISEEKMSVSDGKIQAEVVKDATVSEEEIVAEYDSLVAYSQSTYEYSPSSYGTDVSYGTTVYYAPAGYRYVKNLLISFTDEDIATIETLTTDLATKQTALTDTETSIAALSEEATQEEVTSLNETKETLTAEVAELETQLSAANAAAVANIQAQVTEVETALAAEGADFDVIMTLYGQDPGMTTSPDGYLVSADSTNWVQAFTDASMALASIGDVSSAVTTSYGIHFIQYASDLAEGAVDYDSVKDAISESLLTTKQDALYTETLATWVEEADAKIYTSRL